ncbi:hypothetical protein ACWDOP_00435 [Nocardia sp. NPDC003693]
MSATEVRWEEVPEAEVPPAMSEANAVELLRRIAQRRDGEH